MALPCLALLASLCPGALCPAALATSPSSSLAASAAPSLHGRVVTFAHNGYEPDGDPVDRVIISAQLRVPDAGEGQGHLPAQGGRIARSRPPAEGSFPAMTLVLSTYLENFQTATVPILPDLLRKDVTATSLGGFMQGKAALVDGAGRVRYRGSVLAEVFLDNSIHMVADLDPQGLPVGAGPLRLSGAVALRKDLTLSGSVHTSRALLPAEAVTLRVARPRPVSWQAVVKGLRVRYPKMMGTSGSGVVPSAPTSPSSPTGAAAAPAGGQTQGRAPTTAAPAAPAGSRPVAAGTGGSQGRASDKPSPFMVGALGVALLTLLGAGLSVRARFAGARRSE